MQLQQQQQQQNVLFEWRLCPEGLLARKLGQLLLVKDCVWQANLGHEFHSESSCVTPANIHTQNFLSHPLHHYFPPTLSVCGLVLVTLLRYEREKGRIQGGGGIVSIEVTQGARNRVRRDALGLFPVSSQVIL